MPDESSERPTTSTLAIARRQLRGEPELRAALARWLEGRGIRLSARVVCVAGEPDLVTAAHDAIYEVKLHLTRKAVYQALGQVLLYREAINPEARAVIVGYATPDTIALQPLLAALGVEVLPWENGHPATHTEPVEEARDSPTGVDDLISGPPEATQAPLTVTPLVRSLAWNVAALARGQGIDNASALATRLGVGRQGIYPIWRGEAAQVSLDILARLARTLEAEPGDWFVWGAGVGDQGLGSEPQPLLPNHRPLQWNIAQQAEARGIRVTALGFAAGLHQRSLGPIWRGEAQAVAVETLAKLAQALGRPEQPFGVGDLFTWQASSDEDGKPGPRSRR